jgi:hypothetical protein
VPEKGFLAHPDAPKSSYGEKPDFTNISIFSVANKLNLGKFCSPDSGKGCAVGPN